VGNAGLRKRSGGPPVSDATISPPSAPMPGGAGLQCGAIYSARPDRALPNLVVTGLILARYNAWRAGGDYGCHSDEFVTAGVHQQNFEAAT